jgi:hypothetical protein
MRNVISKLEEAHLQTIAFDYEAREEERSVGNPLPSADKSLIQWGGNAPEVGAV